LSARQISLVSSNPQYARHRSTNHLGCEVTTRRNSAGSESSEGHSQRSARLKASRRTRHKAYDVLRLRVLGDLHRFMDCRVGWDPVQEQELVETGSKQNAHGRGYLARLQAAQVVDVPIQSFPPPQDPVDDFGKEGPIPLIHGGMTFQHPSQEAVGVRDLLLKMKQDLVSQRPGFHPAPSDFMDRTSRRTASTRSRATAYRSRARKVSR